MEIKKQLVRMKVEDLVPYENNPRNIPQEAIDDVKESYRQCGVIDPIEVDENGVILSGHTRTYAATELGIKEVDVLQVTGLTEQQKRKYRILANKTGEKSSWDFQLLELELEDLDFEGYDFGFDTEEFSEGSEAVVEDDFDTEPPEEAISKHGDLWKMGDHLLLVGDSTKTDEIRMLMDGELADLWLTDPPYNVNYQGTAGNIQNDNLEDAQFRAFLTAANKAAYENMKPGASFYIWHADGKPGLSFRAALEAAGLPIRQTLIWVKNQLVLGHSDYQYKHEPCLYGHKPGAGHYFTNSRAESTVIQDLTEIDPKRMKKDELVELVERILSEKIATTVLEFDKPTKNGEHPTMKPVALFDYLIRNSTKKGQIVLDTFAGSGTTIMACEQNGRRARCCELDERYADVIVRRWEAFTGKMAVRLKNVFD